MNANAFQRKRRRLLKGGFAVGAVATLGGALQAFAVRQPEAPRVGSGASPYGPIAPVRDKNTGLELLQLPKGFRYASFSWQGDLMENGMPVPPLHDGMGLIAVRNGGEEFVLVRNHESALGSIIDAPAQYDTVALEDDQRLSGGTTTIFFPRDIDGTVRTVPSLGGTRNNCAGGTTPWGTWLSCEEDTTDHTALGGRPHGYVFEVTLDPADTTGQPITAMGRFRHEAAAVDPRTGYVYMTEDSRNRSGLYRYVPNDTRRQAGSLAAGGRLQAARVAGIHQANLFNPAIGDEHALEWLDIAEPDMEPQGPASGPYTQALAAGALTMCRGEGIGYGRDGMIFIVDTGAGAAAADGDGKGGVWMFDPATDRIRCIHAAGDNILTNNPDNLTLSPRGGVLICEDGDGVADEFGFGERLMGVNLDGSSFTFAKNNVAFTDDEAARAGKTVPGGDYRGEEFCGACFDPTGRFLFVNTQTPGITFAIWGPWERGPF